MPPAATLRDTQIPLPHDPATAGRKAAPEMAAPLCAAPLCAERVCAALRSLLWLVTYVAVMRLLGYRIPRAPAAPKSATPAHAIPPASIPTPTTPPTPRQKHRYLDRAMCLNLLADISSAFAPVQPILTPAPLIPAAPEPLLCVRPSRAPTPQSLRPPPRQAHPAPIIPRAPHLRANRLRANRLRARTQAATLQNPASLKNRVFGRMQTHALFVTIS